MVVHRPPMAPAGAEGGPIDEGGADPSRTGSRSSVRWALTPYIRCDSRRTLAPENLAPRRAGCETSGTAPGVPHEWPGIKGLATAGTARNASTNAAMDDRRPPARRVPVVQCQAGPVPGCSIDGRRHRNSRYNRYIGDRSVGSMLFQSDIDDRNPPEHRAEQSPERRGSTCRASLDGWRCSGSARCLLENPACPGWMRAGMDLPAVAGADPGAFWRITAGVQPSCASSCASS